MNLKGKPLLAYVAGIFDGEGSISISARESHGYRTIGVSICVVNTKEWLITFLKMQFGGYIYFRDTPESQHKNSWQWTKQGKKAVEFLELILPYLQLKRPQAELAIQFQNRKRLGRHSLETQDEAKALEEADRLIMGSYNKRGK